MKADGDDFWKLHLADLVHHARRRLRPLARPVVDPEDVVASALCSFFACRAGNADDRSENLLVLLIEYVERHCQKWNMRVRRHPSLSLYPSQDEGDQGFEPSASSSCAEQTRCFDELVESLAAGLIASEKEILFLMIAGRSNAEIAPRVGRVDRTIRRLRAKLMRRLHELELEP